MMRLNCLLKIKTVFIFTVLTGCAVMRVDVDVYKGPLTDEKHIQAQRLAVMAVGAKPLLIQARDEIGNKYLSSLDKNSVESNDESIEGQIKNYKPDFAVNYEEKYMPDPRGKLLFFNPYSPAEWKSKTARLLNSTLYLYADVEGSDNTLVIESRKALNDYYFSYGRFKSAKNKLGTFLIDETNFKNDNYKNTNIYKYYKNLSKDFYNLSNKNITSNFRTRLNQDYYICSDNLSERRIHYQFEAILQCVLEDTTKHLAKDAQLISIKETEKTEFINIAKNYYESFDESWIAINKLFRFSLLYLIDQSDGRQPTIVNRSTNLNDIVNIIVNIGDYNSMYWIFNNALETGCIKTANQSDRNNKSKLRKIILEDPANSAQILLSADNALKNIATDATYTKFGCLSLVSEKKYGLTYVPYVEDIKEHQKRINDLKDSINRVAKAFPETSSGIETGRIDQGLDKLIEKYLNEHLLDPDSDKTKQARKSMTDSLIRFAQKLLFIAQNKILLDEAGKSVFQSIFTAQNYLQIGKNDRKRYKDLFGIIEVVGNSILVQANELQAMNSYREKMERKEPSTRSAILANFSHTKSQVLNEFMAKAKHNQKSILEQNSTLKKLNLNIKNLNSSINESNKAINSEKEKISEAEKSFSGNFKSLLNIKSTIDDKLMESCLIKEEPQSDTNKEQKTCDNNTNNWLKISCLNDKILATINNGNTALQKQLESFKSRYNNAQECSFEKFKEKFTEDFVTEFSVKINQDNWRLKLKHEKAFIEHTKKTTGYKENLNDLTAELKAINEANPNLEKDFKLYSHANIMHLQDTINKVSNTGSESAEVSVIKAEIKELTTKDGVDQIIDAIYIQNNFSDGFIKSLTAPNEVDARHSMDALITWLETNRIKIIANHGVNSEAYANTTAALEAAYKDRAGLTYIRPASSYLKSSYTSTAVQNSNNRQWTNMLEESYARAIPLGGKGFANQSLHGSLNKIDKQYWQNINTVRVSGGGNTNYVLLRDDVGNFTVRNYSTDYKETLESLQNMVLYNYSEKLNIPIESTLENDDSNDPKSLTSNGSLKSIQSKYKIDFANDTKAIYQTFTDKLTPNLDTQIHAKWTENSDISSATAFDDLKQQITIKYNELIKPSHEKLSDENNKKSSDLIYVLLIQLRKYKNTITSTVATTLSAEVDKIETAQTIANGIIDTLIKTIISKREQSISEYEKSLIFIGDTLETKL